MSSILGAIQNTISISLFNRGLAGKIFDEVKRTGAKVVMKNNTAECVLLSPEDYVHLMDEVNDARLLLLASERMATFDRSALISQDDLDRTYGFTPEDLANADEVEFE
ncbi:MAG: type II toxin-antitoxin system Phd/YefM family antitoxin [Eubacteriales bacterium]|nr:type II toxin-antitoxin system Phd/YefM family antitoxin [Eubacteriales bacterium]